MPSDNEVHLNWQRRTLTQFTSFNTHDRKQQYPANNQPHTIFGHQTF